VKHSGFAQLKARPAAWRRLAQSATDRTEEISRCSAIIFAPHQDDETLGCGGTIIKKRQSGAKVVCVFMTDGRTSHQSFISPDELTELRKREALGATAVLGVAPDDVHFLGFQDGKLGTFHQEAVARVSALIEHYRPHEVFAPYRDDGTPDHESTFRIVAEAVSATAHPVRLCEYPVWFWNQWPWVSLKLRPNREAFKSLRRSFDARFGRIAYANFGSRVFVGDVLRLKRKALEEHRSQMSVLQPNSSWPTLHDVSNGEFLQCFFHDIEVFRVTAHTSAIHDVTG
jgi:LmbE family N-acetylglucosaminyl deacetylase